MPRDVVADASALLPAWLPAERHQATADLLVQLHVEGLINVCAPPLLAHEILNALYIAVRGKAGMPPRLTQEGAVERWQLFCDLRFNLIAVDAIAARIIDIARALERSNTYDASYAALAEHLDAIVVTGDERFINAAKRRLPFVHPVWDLTPRVLLNPGTR